MSQVKISGNKHHHMMPVVDDLDCTQEIHEIYRTMTDSIQGIIFDFDGVIASLETRFVMPIFNAFKSVKPNLKREVIIKSLKEAFIFLAQNADIEGFELVKYFFNIAKKTGLNLTQSIKFLLSFGIYYIKNKEKIKPNIGVRSILKQILSLGYKTALVTNSRRKTIFKEAIEIIPELKEFDLIITKNDVINSKPNAEGFKRVLNHFRLDAKSVISIGDQVSDIVVGKKVGIKTIAIAGNFMSYVKSHIMKYQPDFLIKDFRDIPIVLAILNQNKKQNFMIDLTALNCAQRLPRKKIESFVGNTPKSFL